MNKIVTRSNRYNAVFNRKQAEKGNSVPSFLLWLGLSALALMAVYGAFQMANSGNIAQTVTGNLTQLQSAIHQVAPTENYEGITAGTLIAAGAVPSNITQSSSTTLQGPTFPSTSGPSSYLINGTSGTVTITLSPVDTASCMQIVSSLLAGGNWLSVNGVIPTNYQTQGVSAAQAGCSTGSITAITN